MKEKTLVKVCLLGILLCTVFSGCSNEKETPESREESTEESTEEGIEESTDESIEESTEISTEENTEESTEEITWEGMEVDYAELPEEYQQMSLYLQEGFRIYGIEGSYQVYFAPVEEGRYGFECNILLEGEGKLWDERFLYDYDEETGWYTFVGVYEPIFAKDTLWSAYESSSFVKDMKENYLYKTWLTKDMDLQIPIRYYSDGGPIERKNIYLRDPYDQDGNLLSRLYTYQDDRLDVEITIVYPVTSYYYVRDTEMSNKIDEIIEKAFFYGYWEDEILNPESEMYVEISRQYIVARADENYLSLRIYEYNASRLANHPNEFESGITINVQTGEVMHIEDIIGDEWTLEELLESGAFHTLWTWVPAYDDEDWIQDLIEENQIYDWRTLEYYDEYSDFYLTNDSFGLITSMGNEYTCIEASLEELNKIHPLPILQ